MRSSRISEALESAAARLRTAGVEGPRRDARLLLGEALGVGNEQLFAWPERSLSAADHTGFEALIARRERREPVSRILGRREFWSLNFRITPVTLDPRPDSESLVQAVLERIPDHGAPLKILDLGTGSGCLLLALLSELPKARGLGVDVSEPALQVARENAATLGLAGRSRFERRSWAAGLSGSWQLIVSNPPYIRESEIEGLAPEVIRYDPRLALAAGPEGLDAYRALVPQIASLLAPDGLVALEIGVGQYGAVRTLLAEFGLAQLGCARDLHGNQRCLLATVPRDLETGKKTVGLMSVPH